MRVNICKTVRRIDFEILVMRGFKVIIEAVEKSILVLEKPWKSSSNLFLKMGTNPVNDHFRRSPWGFFSRLQVNVTNLNRAPKFLNFPTKLQS